MSALGHKRTYAVQQAMSALPPRADMCGATRDVRYGPEADIPAHIGWMCAKGPKAEIVSALPVLNIHLRFVLQYTLRLRQRRAEMQTCVCRAKAGRENKRQVRL